MKGQQQIPAHLHTAILTSNYQRENDVTQAVLDRIIFKTEIQPISAKSKRIKVYEDYIKRPNFKPAKTLNLSELKAFVALIDDPKSVEFPTKILEVFDTFLTEFTKESKKYISPRTANKSLKVLKVSSLLNGRNKVEYDDLEELRYVFCVLNRKMEEEIFDAVFEKCVGKAEEEIQALSDISQIETKVSAIPNDFSSLSDQDFITKMRELNEYIHLLESLPSPTQATSQKRDIILQRMRDLVANNRDKLFKRDTKALNSGAVEILPPF
jgi:MoxR-like ATPase